MMEKYYCFADIGLEVSIPHGEMYTDDLQLKNFRTDRLPEPHRFFLRTVEALEPPAGPALASLPGSRVYDAGEGYVRCYGTVDAPYIRAEHRGMDHNVTILRQYAPQRISARLVLNALDAEHLVAQSGGLILHASFIGWQGKAVLFTAPSETGKTTQAELWKAHRNARIINGDRAVILGRSDGVYAAGLPFAGSSRYCENETLPLAAVVYLRQGKRTVIRRLKGVEAFRKIWEGCCVNTWHREDMQNVSALVQRLAEDTAVYELVCTPDESAVLALEQQLRKQVEQ